MVICVMLHSLFLPKFNFNGVSCPPVCNPQMTFSYINVGGLILIYDSQLNPLTTGLITVRLLVVSDGRLRALFSRHGGPALLLSMATATSGILRQEVTNTLQTLSKGRHCLMIGSFFM